MYIDTYIIEFLDGTVKKINGVMNMGINTEQNCFILEKNSYRIFVPRENVKYIGREFDLKGLEG